MLQKRQPETRWAYYRNVKLVPEGMTFFYAHAVLRKLWGESPGNPDPPIPQAYRRPTTAEQDERDRVLQSALHRIDETLERSEALYKEGHAVAATGVLKHVDVLLARFNLALAQEQAGKTDWQDVLDPDDRDTEFVAWLTAQISST